MISKVPKSEVFHAWRMTPQNSNDQFFLGKISLSLFTVVPQQQQQQPQKEGAKGKSPAILNHHIFLTIVPRHILSITVSLLQCFRYIQTESKIYQVHFLHHCFHCAMVEICFKVMTLYPVSPKPMVDFLTSLKLHNNRKINCFLVQNYLKGIKCPAFSWNYIFNLYGNEISGFYFFYLFISGCEFHLHYICLDCLSTSAWTFYTLSQF